jgi:hypothetical protein
MKRIIFSILFIGIFPIVLKAQGLYFSGSVGYGLKAGSTILGNSINSDGSSDVVKGSLGAGFAPSLSVGYLFNKNIGTELGIGYLIGAKTSIKNTSFDNPGTTTFNVNSFYLNPSVVFRSGEGKIVPYGKIGVFLGLANRGVARYQYSTISSGVTTSSFDDKFIDKGRMSLGITAAFGADYRISDRLTIFGELFGRFANWSPSHYTFNRTSTYYTIYEPTGIVNSANGNFVNHVPAILTVSTEPAVIFPLSSIGLNVGVRYYLIKK